MWIEKIRHLGDHGRNCNYHLNGSDIDSVRSFRGYLIYNTLCHVLSLVFVAVYFIATMLLDARYIILDIVIYILVAINIYCIMLQRYTHIKLKAVEARYSAIADRKAAESIELLSQRIKDKDIIELQRELSLIKIMHKNIREGTDCILGESESIILQNIASSSCCMLKKDQPRGYLESKKRVLSDLIVKIPDRPLIIGKTEKRVSRLQKLFHTNKRNNVLFNFGIITETSECENAYKNLITSNSRSSVEFAFSVLLGAYDKTILSLKENEKQDELQI